MNNRTRFIQQAIASLAIAALALPVSVALVLAAPVAIPTGIIDLNSILQPTTPSISSATLTKWRQGAVAPPVFANTITFSYLTGTGVTLPTTTSVKDHSANDQNDLWSDNAVKLVYTRGNSSSSAILFYTNNLDAGASDPLYNVQLRGGYVGGATCAAHDASCPGRSSVLPLLWKAVAESDLTAASTATVNGSFPLPTTAGTPGAVLYMPTEITNQSGGSCPAQGPYAASSRSSNGFCDFSTHYFVDQQNNVHLTPATLEHSWYTYYTGAKRVNAFNYAALVGAYGVNTSEAGLGNATFNPMYALIGTSLANAILTQYATILNVEVLTQ